MDDILLGMDQQEIARNNMPLSEWCVVASYWFRDAKARKLKVQVLDVWEQERIGQIYRNSHDRVNIVALPGEPTFGLHSEVYYMNMVSAKILGRVPIGTPPLFVDWDHVRDY